MSVEIEYSNIFPNCTDPEHKHSGTTNRCSNCYKPFSVWDQLNITPEDECLLCARCKGIKIKLKYPISYADDK